MSMTSFASLPPDAGVWHVLGRNPRVGRVLVEVHTIEPWPGKPLVVQHSASLASGVTAVRTRDTDREAAETDFPMMQTLPISQAKRAARTSII